jgi:acetyl-CoA acetyltransferase
MASLEDVYVVGVGMHRINNDGTPIREMAFVAGMAALEDAGVRFDEIEYVYNGYRPVDPLFNGIVVTKELGLTGVPVTQVENASATGSAAFREAALKVSSGEVSIAMATGWAADLALSGMGEGFVSPSPTSIEGRLLPNAFFAMWAVRRMHEVGTTVETYAAIAAKNWNHARHNPYARRRADHEVTIDEVLASRKIAYPHTSMMSAAVGAGAACAIVANRETAKRIAEAQGRPLIRVLASQMQSERYVPGHVFMGAMVGPSELTRTTAMAAYEQSGVGPQDLSLVHVHDAFPVEELLYMELLGICGDGEADKLVAEGATTLGGSIPFSTDGGLIARGHPGGPTGMAQIWDITTQLRDEAGPRQVEGARVGLAHMMGAGSVCITHILARD